MGAALSRVRNATPHVRQEVIYVPYDFRHTLHLCHNLISLANAVVTFCKNCRSVNDAISIAIPPVLAFIFRQRIFRGTPTLCGDAFQLGIRDDPTGGCISDLRGHEHFTHSGD